MDEATRCDNALIMRDGRFLAHEPLTDLMKRTNTAHPEEAFLALIEEDMKMRTTAATMEWIVAQLKHDSRTVALVLVIPPVLLTLVYYIFVDVPTMPGQPGMFDRIAPIMLVILPMLMMFIVTSVVMLREGMSGTLERIFTTPLTQLSLVASYAVVFTILAFFQSLILGILLFPVFDVSIEGNWGLLLLVAFLCALFGIAFGLLASAFAEN